MKLVCTKQLGGKGNPSFILGHVVSCSFLLNLLDRDGEFKMFTVPLSQLFKLGFLFKLQRQSVEAKILIFFAKRHNSSAPGGLEQGITRAAPQTKPLKH